MKNYFVYLILLVGMLTCSDEFTESPAIGSLSEEALRNETGVDLLLTGAYSTLDGVRDNNFGNPFSGGGDNIWMNLISDDGHKGSEDFDQIQLYDLEILNWSTDDQYIYGKWSALFAGINRANAVIAFIATIEDGDFSAQSTEARFLRGHFNFELQKMWVNVPFISVENYKNTEFNQPNPGPIWDQIEADFQYAIDNLPESQTDIGRPTSWTAMAFLGKTHLYQGEWNKALPLLKNVVEKGPYKLLPDYVDNFREEGDNSVESIFSIQFTTDGAQSYNANVLGTLVFPIAGPTTCCGFYQPSQDLLNAFKTDGNGLPLLDTYNQSDVNSDYGIDSSVPFAPFTGPLDPRADYTVGRRGIDYNGYGENPGKDWVRANISDISGPYLPKKNIYWEGESANISVGAWGQQNSGINYHIMRYADVLLMYAEAAVETGDISTALELVNRIRNRAKNSNYVQAVDGSGDAANYQIEPYASFPDQSYARKAVRFERRLEFGCEAHRLFDLRRWAIAPEVMNEYYINESRTIPTFGDKVGTYTQKYNAFPIPINAIDQSGDILKQNPGF